MSHAATQILNAFVGRLTGLDSVDDGNITSEFVWDHTDDFLPAINVRHVSTIVDDVETTLGIMLRMKMAITVEGYSKLNAGVGDELREIVSDVQSAIYASGDYNLGGLVSEVDVVGEVYELAGDQDKPVGKVTQAWEIVYRALASDPTTIQS